MKYKICLALFLGSALSSSVAENKQALANAGQWLDNKNKVVWARCSLGQRWQAGKCTGKAAKLTWDAAQKYVNQINQKGAMAGKLTWRLPTLKELAGLRSCTKGWARSSDPSMKNMIIPAKVGRNSGRVFQIPLYCMPNSYRPNIRVHAFPNTDTDLGFWSATEEKSDPTFVWNVHFAGGLIYLASKKTQAYVRLVRNSQ